MVGVSRISIQEGLELGIYKWVEEKDLQVGMLVLDLRVTHTSEVQICRVMKKYSERRKYLPDDPYSFCRGKEPYLVLNPAYMSQK